MSGKFLVATVIFALLIVVGFTADIDGRWVGSISGPDGEMELLFTFKVDGDTLTGSVETPMGEQPIQNGKVAGDTFSFDVDAGGSIISHQCTLAGDTIQMKAQGPWGEMELTLKKQNP